MIIVDTSTWIDHIRGLPTLVEELLGQSRIALHPFVFGELMLNGLPKSGPFSPTAFSKLASAPMASVAEVSAFIAWAKLAGTGVGYVDANLLATARLIPGGCIMSQDRNLRLQAERLGLAYTD